MIVPEGDGRWIEYAGGYTDMLAQRGEDVGASRSPRLREGQSRAAEAPSAKSAKRRLSFNEKHALETLPKDHRRLYKENPQRKLRIIKQCTTPNCKRLATARLRRPPSPGARQRRRPRSPLTSPLKPAQAAVRLGTRFRGDEPELDVHSASPLSLPDQARQ